MAIVRVVSAMQIVRARRGRVIFSGGNVTPTQARELAEALKAAAMIAESQCAGLLSSPTMRAA
jgi:preprotein translocase subunit SecD